MQQITRYHLPILRHGASRTCRLDRGAARDRDRMRAMMLALGLMLALWAGMVPPAADAAQSSAPAVCVKLARSEPFPPDEAPLPKYPEDAKAAGVEGDVTFHMEIGSGCAPDEVTIDDGPEALRKPVEDAVK